MCKFRQEGDEFCDPKAQSRVASVLRRWRCSGDAGKRFPGGSYGGKRDQDECQRPRQSPRFILIGPP